MIARAPYGWLRLCVAVALQALVSCGYAMHAFNVDEQYGPVTPWAEDLVIHTSQHVVLGIVGDTDFVDEAHRKLLSSCRDGHLFNIQTRLTTELSFFSYDNHFTLWAVCQRQPPPPPPPPPPPVIAPEPTLTPETPPPPKPKAHHRPHRHHKH